MIGTEAAVSCPCDEVARERRGDVEDVVLEEGVSWRSATDNHIALLLQLQGALHYVESSIPFVHQRPYLAQVQADLQQSYADFTPHSSVRLALSYGMGRGNDLPSPPDTLSNRV